MAIVSLYGSLVLPIDSMLYLVDSIELRKSAMRIE